MNTASAKISPGQPGRDAAFFGTAALVFGGAAAATIHGGLSTSMSMPWMRMPGRTWLEVAAQFLGMWLAMMVAMMLPSLVPMLWRYRRALPRTGAVRLATLTTLVGISYFLVWGAVGVLAFPVGVALSAIASRVPALAHAVPLGLGVLLLLAGMLQFTAWKARHLACCRQVPGHGRALPADTATAWRHGLRRGLHCGYCCAGPTAVLLGFGAMDLRAMALVMLAITTERLAPAAQRVARTIGTLAVIAGLVLIARQSG